MINKIRPRFGQQTVVKDRKRSRFEQKSVFKNIRQLRFTWQTIVKSTILSRFEDKTVMKLALRSRFGQIAWLKILYNHGMLKKPLFKLIISSRFGQKTVIGLTIPSRFGYKNVLYVFNVTCLMESSPQPPNSYPNMHLLRIEPPTTKFLFQHAFAKNWTSNLPNLILTLFFFFLITYPNIQPPGYPSLHVTFS